MTLQPARSSRLVAIAFVLVSLTVWGGYQAGKQMAQRDNARAAATP